MSNKRKIRNERQSTMDYSTRQETSKVSASVLDDVRAYKEYARSNGQSLNFNQIIEKVLQLLTITHKGDMVACHTSQRKRLERL